MSMQSRYQTVLRAIVFALFLLASAAASAQVTVSIVGNQGLAHISLTDGVSTYVADVTISFDSPANLTVAELNLTASLVNPADPALLTRLSNCSPACFVDPAFPMLVTVEPLTLPQMFMSGFDPNEATTGNLDFRNTYQFELHTANIDCTADPQGNCPTTPYRLFKAPVGGSFKDITTDVLKGSVRARGRGGSFSEFLIVEDVRASSTVEQGKANDLQGRIQSASIPVLLQSNLLSELASVQASVSLLNYAAAIANLEQLIADIEGNAGTAIANAWSSDHTLINDAGEMLSLARTLRYTLVRLQNGN
ncbi:MAG: DUF6689 family protein [Dokdonella sp.]